MSLPGELTLESFARNLFNDDHPRESGLTWVGVGSEERRKYRKQAWMLYIENCEQAKVGVYTAVGDRQKDMWSK